MSNAVMDSAITSYGNGDVDYTSNTIKLALMSGTAPDPTDDAIITIQDLLTAGNTIISEVTLASKTLANKEFGHADPTFTAVSGAAITFAIQYMDSGVTTTSPLLALWDTATAGSGLSEFPITPNGLDIGVAFSDPTKVYSL